MADILNSAILDSAIFDSAILVFSLKLTHTCQDWFPPFAQKKLHSFILSQLDDASHLDFYHVRFRHCHLGFRYLVIFSQIHSKTLSLHSDCWLKLIQSDSNLKMAILFWILPWWHFEILNSAILHKTLAQTNGFWLKLSHSHSTWSMVAHLDILPRSRIQPPFAQKNFTHSFWLKLMMIAILNSAMLDSDTAILDSDTLLSSLRFTQKHSHSTLMLTQTNSIWLKLIHSHLTWWCQESWILPSWILPSWIQPC